MIVTDPLAPVQPVVVEKPTEALPDSTDQLEEVSAPVDGTLNLM